MSSLALLASDIRQKMTLQNVGAIAGDLNRHGFIRYVNRHSLGEDYFDTAYQCLDDHHVYIIISNTGSAASEILSIFTHTGFNHVSLAFDRDLTTMVSYNNGEKLSPPGLNRESLSYFNQKAGASLLIYGLQVNPWQKRRMIERVRQINREGSAYNILGIITRRSVRPNMMFCSQFVYCMLKSACADYFEKRSSKVKPMDFVELDYQRRLSYEGEIVF